MKKVVLLVIIVILSLSQPTLAEYADMQTYAGTTAAVATVDQNCQGGKAQMSIQWKIPMFRMAQKERMVIQVVTLNSGNYYGYSLGDISSWVKQNLIRMMNAEAKKRNITLVEATEPKPGYLVMLVKIRLISGDEWNAMRSSNSARYNGKYVDTWYNRSYSDGERSTAVRISIAPTISRFIDKSESEIIAAPEAPIMRTESQLIEICRNESHSDEWSYYHHGRTYSSGKSSSEGSSWGKDGDFTREELLDLVTQRLSFETMALSLMSLNESLQIEEYGEYKDSQTGCAPQAPQSSNPTPGLHIGVDGKAYIQLPPK